MLNLCALSELEHAKSMCSDALSLLFLVFNLYNKTRHTNDWAEIFCGHLWLAWGGHRLKKIRIFMATPGPSASVL